MAFPTVPSIISPEDLTLRVQHVIRHKLDVIAAQMRRNGVDVYNGTARFSSPHDLIVEGEHTLTALQGAKYVIAVGSEPARPLHIPFTAGRIIDSDGILTLSSLPRTLVVVGGGIIGCEYASIFATLGVEVILVDGRTILMEFVDREIVETLIYHVRKANMILRLGEAVASVFLDNRNRVVTKLESGKRLISDTLLFSTDRYGATAELSLEAAGLQADARGRSGHIAPAKVRRVMSHKGFSHIGLSTRDMDSTRHFYEHVLGFTVVRCDILKMTEGGQIRHIFFDTGRDQLIAFMEPQGVAGIPDDYDAGINAGLGVPGSFYHFAFEAGSVAGLEAKRQELLAKGVAVTDLVDHEWAQSIYFHDPNGISLEYCCLTRDIGTPDDVTMQVRVERSVEAMRQRWERLREAASHTGAYA